MVSSLRMKQLYEQDYISWLDKTIEQLKYRDIDNLDWEHLLEQIEALGSEQRHKVDSFLLQLLTHLLLYRYWEREKNWSARGWEKEIDNFRVELDLLLESQTLYNYLLQRKDVIYSKARRNALRKSQLPEDKIPEQCPFSVEEFLDFGFLP